MINGIDYEKFFEDFKKTSVYQKIEKDFDEVLCTNQTSPLIDLRMKAGITFRELYGKTNYVVGGKTSISIVTLYYLKFLLEKNPEKIHDLGCGWNIWKRYYPNIIGIDGDSNNSYADIHRRFDDKFVNDYFESIESLMCVNMNIGIVPGSHKYGCETCTYENYSHQVEYLLKVLKPGGRAYFAISRHGMIKYTPEDWFAKNNINWYDYDLIKNKMLNDIKKLPIDILSFDCELDMKESFPAFDGCVRLVFEKH